MGAISMQVATCIIVLMAGCGIKYWTQVLRLSLMMQNMLDAMLTLYISIINSILSACTAWIPGTQ